MMIADGTKIGIWINHASFALSWVSVFGIVCFKAEEQKRVKFTTARLCVRWYINPVFLVFSPGFL